jgi:hypothetical protein
MSRPPAADSNPDPISQSRDTASPQVSPITLPISAISRPKQSCAPPFEGAQLPEDEVNALICMDCGRRVDTVGHEIDCEATA